MTPAYGTSPNPCKIIEHAKYLACTGSLSKLPPASCARTWCVEDKLAVSSARTTCHTRFSFKMAFIHADKYSKLSWAPPVVEWISFGPSSLHLLANGTGWAVLENIHGNEHKFREMERKCMSAVGIIVDLGPSPVKELWGLILKASFLLLNAIKSLLLSSPMDPPTWSLKSRRVKSLILHFTCFTIILVNRVLKYYSPQRPFYFDRERDALSTGHTWNEGEYLHLIVAPPLKNLPYPRIISIECRRGQTWPSWSVLKAACLISQPPQKKRKN